MRYVARQTGLKPHLIRTWEERYGAIRPQRSASNHRLYADNEIERLSLLKEAVDCGHAISTLAPLSDSDLRGLVERSRKGKQGFQKDSGGALPAVSEPASSEMSGEWVDAALAPILRLNAQNLENVLGQAAVAMPRQVFLEQLVVPLFNRVGTLWQSGRLKIVNEHLASSVVRAVLWDMLRTVAPAETAPRIIVATPVGHWHDIGALASALTASEAGWQACYFGPNLPAEEIAYAALELEGRALCLSIGHHLDDRTLPIELKVLRRAVGSRMPLFVGGAGADRAVRMAPEAHAQLVDRLEALRRRLNALTARGRQG